MSFKYRIWRASVVEASQDCPEEEEKEEEVDSERQEEVEEWETWEEPSTSPPDAKSQARPSTASAASAEKAPSKKEQKAKGKTAKNDGRGAASSSPAGEGEGDDQEAGAKKPRGKGKGKGKGKESAQDSRQTRISKAMTLILRHKATQLGLSIRSDGFMKLDDLLNCELVKRFHPSLKEIQEIVNTSEKQRFKLEQVDGVWLIRANQGHSIKLVDDDHLLERLTLDEDASSIPPMVVHGTFQRHWSSIKSKGLLAGGLQGAGFRNHIHFAVGMPTDGHVISGMRGTSEIVIFLDVPRALQAGVPLYRSANEVILSPGLDGAIKPELFEKVIRLKDGTVLWPEAPGGAA